MKRRRSQLAGPPTLSEQTDMERAARARGIPTVFEWIAPSHWGWFDVSGDGWNSAHFTLDPTYRTGNFNESGGSPPEWIARHKTSNADGNPDWVWPLVIDAYNRVFTPDASGRLPWGTEGYPFDGYGEPQFWNVLPPVTIDGKDYWRTGAPLRILRGAEGGAYDKVMNKVSAAFDSLYDARYGYIVPVPIYAALMPIAAQLHGKGDWTDNLGMMVMMAGLGATLFASLAAWASAGFDFGGLSTEFVGPELITDIPGGGMFDDFVDWGESWAGSDWSNVPVDFTSDYSGSYLPGDYMTTVPESFDPYGGQYGGYDGPANTGTATTDAQYEYAGSHDAYGGTAYDTQTLATADIEDADLGKAMQKLKTANGGFDLNKAAQTIFKDGAGRLFKMVMGTDAQGKPVIRQTPVTLPNGQQAVRLANGQIVPMNQAGIGTASALPSWLLPAGIAAGAALLLGS